MSCWNPPTIPNLIILVFLLQITHVRTILNSKIVCFDLVTVGTNSCRTGTYFSWDGNTCFLVTIKCSLETCVAITNDGGVFPAFSYCVVCGGVWKVCHSHTIYLKSIEPLCENTCLRDFRPGHKPGFTATKDG